MRLSELLGGVDVLRSVGASDVDVTSITHDSRRVASGACFACLPGATTDGHDHAPAAVDAGAVALLCERPLALPVPQAVVADVRAILGPVASRLHGDPSATLRCLGVTGTNGKTTTTYLLDAIAREAGETGGVIGTTGARAEGIAHAPQLTTPEATDLQALLAELRDAGVTTVAMEVSSHAIARHRVDGTQFAATCFTNLSHEHLDFHGTMDEYFETKARLFQPDRTAGAAVTLDDPWGRLLAERTRAASIPTTTFSLLDPAADLGSEGIEISRHGTRFTLVDRPAGRRHEVRSNLVGEMNIANALAAGATAIAGGLARERIGAALSRPLVVPGRLEPVDVGQSFTVLVDYAHTPDALGRALQAARTLAGDDRVLVVFGCGGDRDRAKRAPMGRVAAASADLVFVTADNPRTEDPGAIAASIVEGVRSGVTPYAVELDRRAAIRAALGEARAGDVVLIAGKGHETGQTTGTTTQPFDDRRVAREELEALGCA